MPVGHWSTPLTNRALAQLLLYLPLLFISAQNEHGSLAMELLISMLSALNGQGSLAVGSLISVKAAFSPWDASHLAFGQ